MKAFKVFVIVLCASFAAWTSAQSIFEAPSTRTVALTNASGERIVIGSISFVPVNSARSKFTLKLDESKFIESFLAMRPFKCLRGERGQLCHFPYGEDAEVSAADLSALEYQLMFIRTKPAATHVEARNGIYYKLSLVDQGVSGELFDVDFDPVITPQGDRRRPITAKHLEKADPASHWLPRLLIE